MSPDLLWTFFYSAFRLTAMKSPVAAPEIRSLLIKAGSPEKAKHSMRFFKCGPGEYGEGDRFLGLTNPFIRSTVKGITAGIPSVTEEMLHTAAALMNDPFHEVRLTGVLILVHYARKKNCTQKDLGRIYNIYTENRNGMNNWDLIDLSAEHITGAWLYDKDRRLLYKWIKSDSLWERRIALLSCFYFIRKNDFKDIVFFCEEVLHDKEDLIHKAAGWMLREAGKRDLSVLRNFLKNHAHVMPRTMLRYSIEKLSETERKDWLLRKSLSPV